MSFFKYERLRTEAWFLFNPWFLKAEEMAFPMFLVLRLFYTMRMRRLTALPC